MATVMGSLASVSLFLEHNPDAAFRWWERALEAQPRLVEIRAQYATYGLIFLRRDDVRGLAEMRRAVTDDPRSAYCAFFHSLCLLTTGRTADGVAEVERAYELDPRSFLTLYGRVFVRSLAGDDDGALAAAKTAFGVIGRSEWVLTGLLRAYVQRGQRALDSSGDSAHIPADSSGDSAHIPACMHCHRNHRNPPPKPVAGPPGGRCTR